MKILVIPDTHQNLQHNELIIKSLDNNEVDKVIMLGDYVDDWKSKPFWFEEEHNPINVLNKLKELKDKYKDRLILLIGNHDIPYFPVTSNNHNHLSQYKDEENYQRVSGHQFDHHDDIQKKFIELIPIFDVIHEEDGVVYSHAGVSKTWVKVIKSDIISKNCKKSDLIKEVNDQFHKGNWHELLHHRGISPSGDDECEGPTWIRPRSLAIDTYFNKQIVGHTEAYEITKQNIVNNNKWFVVIDSNNHQVPVFVIDGEKIIDSKTNKEIEEHTISKSEIEEEKSRRKKISYYDWF